MRVGPDAVRASYDPILGQVRLPASAGVPARPSSATRSAPGPGPAERPVTPGGRARVSSGDSWGRYDPITHVWAEPPRDAKFRDQNRNADQACGISGAGKARGPQPRDQGVYNPITNCWVVQPANPRIVAGLSFAPATLFSRSAPSDVKMP